MDYKELIGELRMVALSDGVCYDCNQCIKAATAIETLLAERDAALRTQQTHAKLDRSRWEGCEYCKDKATEFWMRHYYKYCPYCGRPLTEEAWAELERRIGGQDA